MATISDGELRDQFDEVLLRAACGAAITITVAGQPVARLGPVTPQHWVDSARLRQIWSRPPPTSLAEDLEQF